MHHNPHIWVLEAFGLSNTEAGIKLNTELVNDLRIADGNGLLTRTIHKILRHRLTNAVGLMFNSKKTQAIVIEMAKDTPTAIISQGEVTDHGN